jgi:porin
MNTPGKFSQVTHIRSRSKFRMSKFGLLFLIPVLLGVRGFSQQMPAAEGTSEPATTERYVPSPKKYLLGDWGGERTRLEEKGVTFDVHYVVDALSNVSGGYSQANTAWGRIRATTDLDLGRLANLHGTSVHATGVYQYGANLGEQYIGSLANPSSLASAHTLRLDSWWVQQIMIHNKLVLRAGQFAGQDFYGVREYGASFLSEPMGYAFGNLFGTVYQSFDPASPPAAEARVNLSSHIYVKTAVLSGNRDPYKQDPNGLHFKIKDSPVFVSETGYLINPPTQSTLMEVLGPKPSSGRSNLPGIYKIGSAYNPGKFTDPLSGVRSGGNYLIYFEAAQAVFRRGPIGKDARRGLDLTFGYDWSPSDVNRLNTQFTVGTRYIGLFPHRELDELALGLVHSQISSHFNVPAAGTTPAQTFGSEQAIELSYRSLLKPWLVFQPDFQYIVDPGALDTSKRGNAAVLGFRTKVTF